jgi:RHS repeat-associated protein
LWCISDTATYTRIIAQRRYEISNHLGNVLATVLDRKTVTTGTTTTTTIAYNAAHLFRADIATATDYYAFGQPMPTRQYTASFAAAYRYGFNGKENDGSFDSKTIQDYGFRLYSPALCKFLSVDPLTTEYPELTPYQFASNTPIQAIDLDGLEGVQSIDFTRGVTTIEVGLYYQPNTKLKTVDWGYTEKEAKRIQSNIMGEFNKHKFIDEVHYNTEKSLETLLDYTQNMHRSDYKGINFNTITANRVELVVGLIPMETTSPANGVAQVKTINGGDMTPGSLAKGTFIYENRNPRVIKKGADGEGDSIEGGASTYSMIRYAVGANSHSHIHELWHNLVHNHQNQTNKNLITRDADGTQTTSHNKADGIFRYTDADVGGNLVEEDLTQNNINQALQTITIKQ